MFSKSISLALVILVGCSHTPQVGVSTTTEVADPVSFQDDSPTILNAEEDEAFLEQSLELALFPWKRDQIALNLRKFVESKSRAGRWLLRETPGDKPRSLVLVRIRPEMLHALTDGRAAVCGEFLDENSDKVDVDFTIERSDTGDAERIIEYRVHKVNGQARYHYLEKEGAWVRSARFAPPLN